MKIPIVDENDNIIGYKERKNRNPEDIIRITSIWITDNNGNILLAQRSWNKKDNPGKWGPAVAGTVEEGESYESNAYKELAEEIGIKNEKLIESEKVFLNSPTGKKFCQLYGLQINREREFIIEKEEVEQVKWYTRDELKKYFTEKPQDFVKSFETLQKYFN